MKNPTQTESPRFVRKAVRPLAFTLIELLAVVAIIALLIGLLMPSLSRARDQAKSTKVRSGLKSAGDGLELFRSDHNNSEDLPGEGYPSSRSADDPTESGTTNTIYGAQWLVRYLAGKDLRGYVSKWSAPRNQAVEKGWEQKGWYPEKDGDPEHPRGGPYIPIETFKAVAVKKVPRGDGIPPPGDEQALEQPVFVDVFGFPILYYAANARLAAKPASAMATYGEEEGDGGDQRILKPGIYNYRDNGLFTGLCRGTVCEMPPWDFTGSGRVPVHEISSFGQFANDIPNKDDMVKEENRHSFCWFILNKNAFESSKQRTLTPLKKESFILLSAGRDGVYGTPDDVNNLQ
jgi:type II secretory pathway pseudopilin PulG